MAEITRRRIGKFLRELFSILMAAPEGMRASEALQLLASRFTLSPYEADHYESGSHRFEKSFALPWSMASRPAGW